MFVCKMSKQNPIMFVIFVVSGEERVQCTDLVKKTAKPFIKFLAYQLYVKNLIRLTAYAEIVVAAVKLV